MSNDPRPVRMIDTRAYVSALREVVQEGREVTMTISGYSMSPFLAHNRDRISFRTPDRPLRRGDIVFYERENGQFVCHRIVKVTQDGYYMVGDNQSDIEGPLAREQIFGLITKVERKGKWIGPGDFWWDFFEQVWIRIIPFRRIIKRNYGRVMRIIRPGRNKQSL